MGEIDKSVKSYVKIPEIFTQLFNECFFDKEHYISAGRLVEQDSVLTVSGDKHSAERIRDVCMLSASGMQFRIILGVEEQTDIHYYMPVRVMQMDSMNYEYQCRKKAAAARKRGENFAPVEGVPKGTCIYPVMTIILYVGRKKWDGPTELYDMFNLSADEKNWLRKFVVNYPVYLIDARHMGNEELNRFTGDLKIFFTLLRDKYDEETVKGMIAKYPDTWYTLAVVKGDERYRECARSDEESRQAEGGSVVDPNLDRIENKGFQRGIKQGISQGISQGINQGISQGFSLLNELYRKLIAEGRDSDLHRSLEDESYQMKLLEEYGLMKK